MSTSCACPPRLHCSADEPHPACTSCDLCLSANPAVCLGPRVQTRAELYRAALAADQRFAAELKKAYGRDACNRRYDADTSKHPPAVREAYAEFRATNEAWLEAMRSTFNTPEEEVGDVVCFEVPEPA